MKLVIGLGNPGRDYVSTRHNVGFDVVDAVAERLGWVPKGGFNNYAKSAFDGFVVDGMLSLHSTGQTEKLVLLKPTTYMNESGRAVRAATDFYKITPGEILVIVDDLALPVGKLRLRPDGSDGGHNGLKSIQQVLGSNKYPRLRIGIGPKPAFIEQKDFVLSKFAPADRPLVEGSIGRAASCVVTWADIGLSKAMNQFNVEAGE